MLNWSAKTGQFTPGLAATERALTPAATKPLPGFSLSPGQTRFDAAGNQIAKVPKPDGVSGGNIPRVVNLPVGVGGGDASQDTEDPSRSVQPDKSVPVVVGGNRWQVLPQPKPGTSKTVPPLPSSIGEIPVLGADGKPDPEFVALPNARGGVSVQRRGKGAGTALANDKNYQSLLKQREAAFNASVKSVGTSDEVDKAQAYRLADDMVKDYEKSKTAPTAAAPQTPKGGDYKSADDVKAAFDDGKISREDAAKMLQDQFGFTP